MAYSKLHASLIHSSLWCEADHVRLQFITLLALCDKDGCVYGSRGGIERAAMIDPDACEANDPWKVLMSPDKDSSDHIRAPEHEGRRIEEISGGFRLLNFAYYRGLRNDDDRAAQNREAQARYRSKQRQPPSATVSRGKPPKAQAEADTDSEASEESIGGVPPHPVEAGGLPASPAVIRDSEPAGRVFAYYLAAGDHSGTVFTEKRRRLVRARMKEGFTEKQLTDAITGYHRSPHHRGENERNQTYLGFDLMLRDAAKVEAGLGYLRDHGEDVPGGPQAVKSWQRLPDGTRVLLGSKA